MAVAQHEVLVGKQIGRNPANIQHPLKLDGNAPSSVQVRRRRRQMRRTMRWIERKNLDPELEQPVAQPRHLRLGARGGSETWSPRSALAQCAMITWDA